MVPAVVAWRAHAPSDGILIQDFSKRLAKQKPSAGLWATVVNP